VASAAAAAWAAGEVPEAPVAAWMAAAVGAVASLATAVQRTLSVAAEAVNLTVIVVEVGVPETAGWVLKVTAAAVAMVTLVETVPPAVAQ